MRQTVLQRLQIVECSMRDTIQPPLCSSASSRWLGIPTKRFTPATDTR
jgi:hypothetical protein